MGSPGRGGGWGRIALIGLLGMMSGSLLQYSINVASPALVESLEMSEPQVGLAAALLMASATVLVRFVGPLADRIGARRALALLFISAAVSLVILAVARSLAWVLVAAVVGGLAVACGNPVTNMVVMSGRHVGSGLIVGIKQSGVMVAQILCGVAVPTLALLASWRWGVAVLLVMPALGLVLTAGLTQERPQPAQRSGGGHREHGGSRRVLWLTVYSFLAAWAISTLTTYLPVFVVSALGESLTTAGTAVIAMGVAGFGARLGWATLAGVMSRPNRLLAALSALGAVSIGAVAAAGQVSMVLLWVGAVGAGSCLAGFTGVVQVIVLRVSPRGAIGNATSVVQLGFLGGLFAGPAVAGLLLAVTGYAALWGAAVVAAGVSAVVAAVGPSTTRGAQDQ